MNQISFPGLGILDLPVDPVAFTLPIFGGMDIMWYAVIITCGFIAAFLYAWLRAKHTEGYRIDDLLDMMIFVILFGVLGARLYYVLMSPNEFDSFFDVLNIRSGGLAIYGGLICGVCAILGVCKVKKMNLWRVLDMVAPGVMIAQAIGRWGNFMNAEAYGAATTLPWRMCSPSIASEMLRKGFVDIDGYNAILDGSLGVHPTFLYESLWNVLGFVVLNLVYRKKKYNGQILLSYLIWYGFGRMWIEGLRTDSLYLGAFRISQLISFLAFTAGLTLFIIMWIKGRKAPVINICSFCTEDRKRVPVSEESKQEEPKKPLDTEPSAPMEPPHESPKEPTIKESTPKGEENNGTE